MRVGWADGGRRSEVLFKGGDAAFDTFVEDESVYRGREWIDSLWYWSWKGVSRFSRPTSLER